MSLRQAGEVPDPSGASVWIFNPVFSPHAWQDGRIERLQRTMKDAREIETWLRRAAK